MPQYYEASTDITWNYILSGSNATIGTPVNWATFAHISGGTTLRASLSGAITIPSTVDGYTVTGIGDLAFSNCSSLTSITIPDSVTTIGETAFAQCSSLTSITIPGSVTTIGIYAFGESGLTSIDIPNSVTSIGERAFNECFSLTSITIPDSVTTIDSQVFYKCSSLTSIDLGNSVTTIGYAAFALCSILTSIDIPNSVTSIGEHAFNECFSLTSITIPDSVTTIGSHAFYNISFSSTVYVKDVDPNDAYTITTLQNTMAGKTTGVATYTQWVDPNANAAPGTPTLSSINCDENTPYTATVSATDADGDSLTFSLSGADAADFTLTGTSLSANAVFDFETKATYNITITASDGSLNTSADFTITVNDILEPTCFPAGTPIQTDQGVTAIDQLIPGEHTLRGKTIFAITQTPPLQNHIICFEKDSIAKNVPSQQTLCSKEHKVLYQGEMIKARDLADMCKNVKKVSYNGEGLYNVLLEKHGKMLVNNMICETLHPENITAKFAKSKSSVKRNVFNM